jgi:cell division protein FtsB
VVDRGPFDDVSTRRRTERASTPRSWARRALWPVMGTVLLVGVLFVGVYPTQTYFRQRDELGEREAQLDDLEATRAALTERVDELNDPEHLELMARRDHGLVRPGEEVYAVVPVETDPVALPDTWPFTQLSVRLERQVD